MSTVDDPPSFTLGADLLALVPKGKRPKAVNLLIALREALAVEILELEKERQDGDT